MTVGSRLSGIKLLSSLSSDEFVRLEQQCRWRRFGAQEQIIDRMSDSRDVCFVVEGRARIVIYSLSGREVALDEINAGGHFGELAAIDGRPRSASVIALQETLVGFLPPDRFIELMMKHPSIAITVMRHMARIIRMSTERIIDLTTLGANYRVEAEILRQAREAMAGPNSAIIRPIPVHSDIAGRASTTRETVARVMNQLARQGLLRREKGALVIPDVERLATMVEDVRGE